MIVLNNNNATISILTSGIDVALTVWGAKNGTRHINKQYS